MSYVEYRSSIESTINVLKKNYLRLVLRQISCDSNPILTKHRAASRLLSKLIKLKQKPPTRPGLKLLTREKAKNQDFLITKKSSKKFSIL